MLVRQKQACYQHQFVIKLKQEIEAKLRNCPRGNADKMDKQTLPRNWKKVERQWSPVI